MRYFAILAGFLVLSGCSSAPRTYAQGSSEYLDDYECRQEMQKPDAKSFKGVPYKSYADCRADKIYVGELLSRITPVAATAPAAASSPSYYPAVAAVPASDAPVLQNIIPPTVRCQSMNVGSGMMQTNCR